MIGRKLQGMRFRSEILQVIPSFAPKHGGPVKNTYYLASKLVNKRTVTVITSDFEFDEKYVAAIENKV